jgi:hypothetical protein
LPVVAYHANVLVPGRQQFGDLVLGMVGVLILIHHDVPELLLIFGQDVRVLAKHFDCPENEVVEVERSGFGQQFLIKRVHFGGRSSSLSRSQRLVFLRPNQFVFGAGDEIVDEARGELLVVNAQVAHGLFYRRLRIRCVKHEEV